MLVDKPLTLEGQNSTDTVILGSGGSTPTAVLILAADNVKVSGFTIESRNYSKTTMYAYGIWVDANNMHNNRQHRREHLHRHLLLNPNLHNHHREHCEISIKNGICFYGGSQNIVSDNNVVGNAVSGIEMAGYSNVISKNNVVGNFRGVGLGASYSVVFGNNIAIQH